MVDSIDKPRLSRPDTALHADIRAFLELRRELLARAPGLVPQVDVAAAIAAMSNRELVDLLWATRGRRSCLVLRTRISQRAEAEDGRRSRGRGKDLI
jgi:hypothetical protein